MSFAEGQLAQSSLQPPQLEAALFCTQRLDRPDAELFACCRQGTPLAYGNLKPISTNQNFISYQWFKAVLQVSLLCILGNRCACQLPLSLIYIS